MNDIKYGMEGYTVKLLQYALARAGMEPGDADGIFGRRTAKALQQFQRERGLAADGVAGKLTWAALYPYISGYTLHRITAGDTLYRGCSPVCRLPEGVAARFRCGLYRHARAQGAPWSPGNGTAVM